MTRPIEFVDTSALAPEITASEQEAIVDLGSAFSKRIKARVAEIMNSSPDQTNLDIRPLGSVKRIA